MRWYVAVLGLLVVVGSHAQAQPSAAGARRYALFLGNTFAATPLAVSGGNLVGEAVSAEPGPDGLVRKHLGNLHIEPFVVEVGLDLSPPLREWVRSMLHRTHTRQSGRVLTLDAMNRIIESHEFIDALLTGVLFPAVDASSSDRAARIVLTFTPERVSRSRGDSSFTPPAARLKAAAAANFWFRINGLESPLARTSRVEVPEVSLELEEQPIGEFREPGLWTGALEVGGLRFVVPEPSQPPVATWFQDFVVNGNNSGEAERTGTLEFLTPNLKDVILTLTFRGLGIVRLAPQPSTSDPIRRHQVDLYCEEVDLQ